MPLSGDNKATEAAYALALIHFEDALKVLLQACSSYQKKIATLSHENEALKKLVQTLKTQQNTTPLINKTLQKALKERDNQDLLDKVHAAIKEIDGCLAYFEQIPKP